MDLVLKPEFFVDLDGTVKAGPITMRGDQIIAIGKSPDPNNAKEIRLANQVLMPGFVNCHSHAFQRALRGLVERGSKDGGQNDFWSWREKMYSIVEKMTKDDFELIARLTYLEMLEAGFTHVGEFHYLHHDVGGKPFKDPLTMSRAVAGAAEFTGINVCLLECAYNRRNFHEPLSKEQLRFGHHDVNDFLDFVEHAKNELERQNVRVGAAIHSVRAVPEAWFSHIGDFVTKWAMPLHVHASEQQQEVADCLTESLRSPIGLLNDNHLLTPQTTVIHATHLIGDDIQAICHNRPQVCICPSTEKNLGDGVIPLHALHSHHVKICIGTDQHVRLDPFSEARSLEEQERLRLFRRNVLTKHGGYLYQALLPCLTSAGLASLDPTLEVTSLLGKPANLIAIELPPEYLWHGPEVALDAIMLAHHPSKIVNVITNGRFVVQDGELLCREKSHLINELRTFFHKINCA